MDFKMQDLIFVVKKCHRCGVNKEIKKRARFCDSCKIESSNESRIRRYEYTRNYRNTAEYRIKRNAQVREKLKKRPKLLLAKRIRNRIYLFLKLRGMVRLKSTREIIGCDYDFLQQHLEKQFVLGMTWQNMGEWHIEHKRPLASAKTRSEILELNHYTNLRPMWAIDNLKKGTRYNGITY